MAAESHIVDDLDFDKPNNQFTVVFKEGPTINATFPKPAADDLANRNILNVLMDSLLGGIQVCVQLNGNVIQRVAYGACQTHLAFCADLRLMGNSQAATLPPPSAGKGKGKGKSASPKAGKANGAAKKGKK